MDNLTHSLVGFAVAEATTCIYENTVANKKTPKNNTISVEKLRPILWFTSIFANNAPDLDFLYTWITPGKLGSLLHHRGHTHTILFAPLMALLTLSLLWLWSRNAAHQKKSPFEYWNTREYTLVVFLAILGPLLHIFMDYQNMYGVHPFWPWDNTWHYGDTLFIIEPWLWITLLAPLIRGLKSKKLRWIFLGIYMGVLALTAFSGYVPWILAIMLISWSIWLLGLMYKLTAGLRISVALTASTIIMGIFFNTSQIARSEIKSIVERTFIDTDLQEIALSPLPANPFCWSFLTVETTADLKYISRRGMFALSPKHIAAIDCPAIFGETTQAPLAQVKAPVRPEVTWHGQFQANLSELRSMRNNDCRAAAMLQFLRIPFWVDSAAGKRVLGDMRFDRSKLLNFSKTEVFATQPVPSEHEKTEAECKHLPPWIEPRADLF